MSRNSLRYGLNQQKYSLKFIIYLFILLDIFLYFNIHIDVVILLLGWEACLFLGLLIGLRGQGRYKQLVSELIAIRRDPKYENKEDLRGHALKRHIDHAMIEYDIWFQNQSKNKLKKKVRPSLPKKKTKKKRGDKRKMQLSEEVIKELLYWVAGIWLFMTFGLFETLVLIGFRLTWVIIICGIVGLADFLFFWYLKEFWGIEKEDVKVIPVPLSEIDLLKAEIKEIKSKL